MTTELTNQRSQTHRISGYRIDETGIYDRFLPWRHFGYWKFAQKAHLQSSDKFTILFLTFDGRKKPLKVQFSSNLNGLLKVTKVLELAVAYSADLILNQGTRELLKDVLEYQELIEDPKQEGSPELRLSKAGLLMELGDSSKARKEVKGLLEAGGKIEERARTIRLRTYFKEADEILAEVEYKEITKRFPNNQLARALWAAWNLARETDKAEDIARETISSLSDTMYKLELEPDLINFLVRKRRYEEAVQRIDRLLSKETIDEPDLLIWLRESKSEIEKLISDQKYNKQQTLWRPLRAGIIAFAFIGFIAIAVLWPAVQATPELYRDITNLKELENHGEIAPSGKFSPNTSSMDFGFVRLSFVFSLRGERSEYSSTPEIHSHYGSAILRREAANAILANTKAYSVVYLPEAPFTCTVYPISKELYFGVIFNHSPAFFFPLIILVLFLFYVLKDMYKKFKYRSQLEG